MIRTCKWNPQMPPHEHHRENGYLICEGRLEQVLSERLTKFEAMKYAFPQAKVKKTKGYVSERNLIEDYSRNTFGSKILRNSLSQSRIFGRATNQWGSCLNVKMNPDLAHAIDLYWILILGLWALFIIVDPTLKIAFLIPNVAFTVGGIILTTYAFWKVREYEDAYAEVSV